MHRACKSECRLKVLNDVCVFYYYPFFSRCFAITSACVFGLVGRLLQLLPVPWKHSKTGCALQQTQCVWPNGAKCQILNDALTVGWRQAESTPQGARASCWNAAGFELIHPKKTHEIEGSVRCGLPSRYWIRYTVPAPAMKAPLARGLVDQYCSGSDSYSSALLDHRLTEDASLFNGPPRWRLHVTFYGRCCWCHPPPC